MSEPLKTLDKLWDKIAKANLPLPFKCTLLFMVTLAILISSFWTLIIVKQIADLVEYALHVP